MNDAFFSQLGIPHPDVDLEVGSASHAVQTAQIMIRFETVVDAVRPVAVLVVGDVNSTIACALVAVKKGIPVIHVEAGLRSHDRGMPEEINRVLTDQLSSLLFTTEADAIENLRHEGIDEARYRKPAPRGNRRGSSSFRGQRDDRYALEQPPARRPCRCDASAPCEGK
jgi:UDP-N-acetylglucosamine 2-epimerase (non-hydrolysing)